MLMLCARYNDSITKILTRPWGKVNEDRDHLSLALDKQALESPSGPPIRKHIVLDSDQEINFLANNSELNAPPDISNATTNALIGIFFNISSPSFFVATAGFIFFDLVIIGISRNLIK
tara:strand:- start:49210 stop:49563 length:354 start_codon:yes stop_codon:yes gene_type:complete